MFTWRRHGHHIKTHKVNPLKHSCFLVPRSFIKLIALLGPVSYCSLLFSVGFLPFVKIFIILCLKKCYHYRWTSFYFDFMGILLSYPADCKKYSKDLCRSRSWLSWFVCLPSSSQVLLVRITLQLTDYRAFGHKCILTCLQTESKLVSFMAAMPLFICLIVWFYSLSPDLFTSSKIFLLGALYL